MTAVLINTVDAPATYGLTLSEAPGWADSPPRQVRQAHVIDRAGARRMGSEQEQPRKLVLRGLVQGDTVQQARDRLDSLKIALMAATVDFTFSDITTRYVRGTLESFTTPSEGPFLIQRKLRVEIALTCLDPYFYDISTTSVGSGVAMPLGTGIVRPVLTVTGPATGTHTNPSFTFRRNDGTTITTLTFTGTLVAGETLTVDLDAMTAKKGAASVIANMSGDFFVVDPVAHATYSTSTWPNILLGGTGTLGTLSVGYKKAWR